jgi:hypothetical protein
MKRRCALVVFVLVSIASSFSIAQTRTDLRDLQSFDDDNIEWTLLAEGVWEGDDGGNGRKLHIEGEAGLLWEIDLLEGWLRRIDKIGDSSDLRFKELYKEKLQFLYHAYFVYHGGTRPAKTDCSQCEPRAIAWADAVNFPTIGRWWADAFVPGPFISCPSSCQVMAGVAGRIWSDSSPTQQCSQHVYDYIEEIPDLLCRTNLRSSFDDNECARATFFWWGTNLFVEGIDEEPYGCYECPNCGTPDF